jgi:hypothetical protein
MPILNSFNPGAAVNTGTDTITIPNHGLVNAQGVVYSNGNGSSIGGLVNGYKYYVIFVDSSNIKLANTEVEARATTVIDLLSTGAGTTHLLTTTTEYPNSAAYYDFFRKFRFIGTGIVDPEGYTIEADNVRDTLTIIGGTNIEFTQPQSGVNDTITINGPDYDLVSPTGVANGAVVRLENVGVEYHDLKLSAFRGIRIERVATNEIEFESFGVTETDTLHTVSSRGNLTSNDLVMNNLLVGKIQSTPGIDGFINVSVSSGDAYNGDGTLDNPLLFSPDESQRTDAAKTITLNFSAPSPGTFSYVAVYRSSAVLLSGYVQLERENPSTLVWETLDYTAGTLARTSYDIENIYAELDTGPVNYRITFNWTGNTEFVNYRVRLTYEVEPIAGNEIILTDTDNEILTLGTSTGTVNLRGTIGVVETLNFDGLKIFQNNIDGNTSNSDINIRPNGTGDLVVTADTDILGDLIVRGGDLTTDKTTFNLLNTTATTVNAFGAANSAVIATNASSIQLGNFTLNGSTIDTDDSSGITFVPAVTLNSDLTVENDLTVTNRITSNNIDTKRIYLTNVSGSVALGLDAGIIEQSDQAVAIGPGAGYDRQETGAVAIGPGAGYDRQGTGAIAIGSGAGIRQEYRSVAIGYSAGKVDQGGDTIAIGPYAGEYQQGLAGTGGISIGYYAGNDQQGSGSIALGYNTGRVAQGAISIAIGSDSGEIDQGEESISIGVDAGQTNQGDRAIAIGVDAGRTNQGDQAIAIGRWAGPTNQPNNSIIFNASNSILDGTESGLYIAPIRNVEGNRILFYDSSTKEITYGNSNTFTFNGSTIDTSDSSGISFTPLVTFNSDIVVENDITVNRALSVGTNLIVGGNLTVNGTTTTLNTTTLDIEDINITVAKGALSNAAANGAGLTVDGALATITYASADDSWNFNKILRGIGIEYTPIGELGRDSGKFTTLDANGNVIIGSNSTDTVSVNATITSNLIFTDNTYDIGATGATRPRSLFLSQNATLGGNLQVDGNTTIGNADTDTITVGGSFVTGTALRTAKTATNTLSLAAYDVDGTAYTNLITLTAGNTPSLALTSIGTGSIDNMTIGGSTAAAGTFTNLTASGLTSLAEITEVLNTKTAATGVVTHDFSTGAIWYHSSISANFTVNLTNVPTTNDRIITVSLLLNQGATGRLPSAFQIDGVAQTIRWQNNVIPTPNINIIEIATFSLIRTGSTWFVLGQLAPFA